MLAAARARTDLTAMEHLSILQSLTLAYLAYNQDAEALKVSGELIASAGANLGEENLRLLPFWNTRAKALNENGQQAQSLKIYDELLKWRNLSDKVRFALRMNRLLAGTSQIEIDAQSKKLAWDFWHERTTQNAMSRAYTKIALLRVLSSEKKMRQARTIAAMPDVVNELDEPVLTELRIWREVLAPGARTQPAAKNWSAQLQNVDSRDPHLRALTRR